MKDLMAGIDLHSNNIMVGIVDREGKRLAHQKLPCELKRIEEFLTPFPEFAPYAHWVPILFYVLALWSFLRAIRSLQRLAASRMWTPRIRVSGASGSSQPAGGRRSKAGPALAVTRPPTVQRMR